MLLLTVPRDGVRLERLSTGAQLEPVVLVFRADGEPWL